LQVLTSLVDLKFTRRVQGNLNAASLLLRRVISTDKLHGYLTDILVKTPDGVTYSSLNQRPKRSIHVNILGLNHYSQWHLIRSFLWVNILDGMNHQVNIEWQPLCSHGLKRPWLVAGKSNRRQAMNGSSSAMEIQFP
jgi:hypothetical protein